MTLSLPQRAIPLSLALLGALLWQLSSPLQPLAAQESESEGEEDVVVETTDNPRFSCQFLNSEHTVAYSPVEQPNQNYAWASPRDLGGGWTAERRCAEISRRLEEYRPDGLVELRTGMENGYNVICVTTEDDPSCRIVFTVPPGQDPIATRDAVFDNLTLADSGQNTQGVPTLREGDRNILTDIGDIFGVGLPGGGSSGGSSASSTGINLRPFLAPSDRGTGERLNLTGRTLPPIDRPTTQPSNTPSGGGSGDLSF
ncbi:MAG: COP23 domain-containing protein [Cyanobacteria bacterium P01_G01_bin.54]